MAFPPEKIRIVPLAREHARSVAQLHISGIPTGFLSTLGVDFVTNLYQVLSRSRESFGFVVFAGEQVIGMATFTADLNQLYRTAIRSSGLKLGWILWRKLLSWERLRRVFETLFYPNRLTQLHLPKAEILSMAVQPEAGPLGLGPQLIKMGLEEFRRRGVDQVKILAAETIKPVNKMYRLLGFKVATTIENHGVNSNVYVVPTDFPMRC